MRAMKPTPIAALLLALAATLAPLAAQAFDLQGHRGARGLAPENTLPSFERAIQLGVTTLELDVAVTSDGVMVIHHDRGLNPDYTRDASGHWLAQHSRPIHQMTLAEVQAHDIGRLKPGTRYAGDHAEQVAMDGTRVPQLSDLFEMVQRKGHSHIRFAIETKLSPLAPDEAPAPEPFAAMLVAEVRKAGLQGRVQILSFDWRTLQVVQRIAPDIPTVYLSAQQSWIDNIGAGKPEGSPWVAGFQHRDHGSVPQMIKAAGGKIWSVFHGDVDAARVKQAQSLGLKVLVWTVNDVPTMHRVIDTGADGLITDRPDTARQVLAARGIVPQ